MAAPRVLDPVADDRFRALAARRGLDPDARFVGGYVGWEWAHARHVFDGLVGDVRGAEVLEVGCNVGATAIVLAALGARVTAVEPDPDLVEIARANAARFGLAGEVRVEHVTDTTRLPYPRGRFRWVSCNSVLEYVPERALRGLLREIDRVLAPAGIVAVLGTSNRLWPKEQHARRWLRHYLPRGFPGAPRIRGITATMVRRELGAYDDVLRNDGGRLFVELKARMGARGLRLQALRAGALVLASAGISPGSVGPTLTMLLRKRALLGA
jgi:2-polyprenyl-3-methyl-5-hydroxy-6-metoxy-1,4-benzoquinol methylase